VVVMGSTIVLLLSRLGASLNPTTLAHSIEPLAPRAD
jgi:hypothetical protein